MYFSLKESIIIISFVIMSVIGVSYAAPTQTAPGGQPSIPLYTITPATAQSKLGEAPANRTSADVVRRALAIGIESNSCNFGSGSPSLCPPALGQTVYVNGITKVGSLTLPSGTLSDGLLVDGDIISTGTTTVSKTNSGSTDGNITITNLAGVGIRRVCIVQGTRTLGFANPWTYNVLTICP